MAIIATNAVYPISKFNEVALNNDFHTKIIAAPLVNEGI